MNPCIVCGSTSAAPFLSHSGHQLWRCERCGFVFVDPVPSAAELAAYYATQYSVPLPRDAQNSARHAARLADLERWLPGRGRLLEVGASHGFFLHHACQQGWEVAGVELSPGAAAHARDTLGLDLFNGDLLDAPLAAGSFDAAVLWHVLEHTQDPLAQLVRLRTLLRPGGVLGLRVPNVGSAGARLGGRAWAWFSPPAHLWYFDPHTLPRLLARFGFTVIDVQTLRGDGNNRYQHALAGAGMRLNGVLRRARYALPRSRARAGGWPTRGGTDTINRPPAPGAGSGGRGVRGLVQAINPYPPLSEAVPRGEVAPTRTVQLWLAALRRAQPLTDALDRLGPNLDAAHGDELLVYARVPQ